MPIEKSAGAVIFRRESNKTYYLIIQYGLGHWDFPRGLIEKGEAIEETARREIEEETGIKELQFLEGFKETIRYFYKFKGENILKFVTYFLAETREEEVELSFEHKDFKWLIFEEAQSQLTFKSSKGILEKAHEYLMKHTNINK